MPVSAHNLVRAITGQNYLVMLCRHPGNNKSRDQGRIGKRLVKVGNMLCDYLLNIRLNQKLLVVGLVLFRHQTGQGTLIKGLVAETDGKGVQGTGELGCGQGCYQAAVYSP